MSRPQIKWQLRDIILTGADAARFMRQMISPDVETMKLRDAFFKEIDRLNVYEENGVTYIDDPELRIDEITNIIGRNSSDNA